MSRSIVTVSALVRYLKSRLESDPMVQHVLVEGEISNFSSYRSGHWYFSLKDAGAQIRCVMFSYSNRTVAFSPKDGDKVIVQGDISIFESRGEMQLLVTGMKPSGIGDLFLQYEQLKKRLAEEGLFDESHKKPIPRYPFEICLITGKNTAARADVLNTVARRWPVARITEYPVLVQGNESAAQIRAALLEADSVGYDVILLVRGGGSIEDLWSFNDEKLARIIYALHTPIITGIGHEVDFTIADFAADLRAPTPTGAAERATPDLKEVAAVLSSERRQLENLMKTRLSACRQTLDHAAQQPVFRNPQRLFSEREMHVNALAMELQQMMSVRGRQLSEQLERMKGSLLVAAKDASAAAEQRLSGDRAALQSAEKQALTARRYQLEQRAGLLDAYSPLKVLQRGYSITMSEGAVIREAGQLHPGDQVTVRLGSGSFDGTVDHTKTGE